MHLDLNNNNIPSYMFRGKYYSYILYIKQHICVNIVYIISIRCIISHFCSRGQRRCFCFPEPKDKLLLCSCDALYNTVNTPSVNTHTCLCKSIVTELNDYLVVLHWQSGAQAQITKHTTHSSVTTVALSGNIYP